MYFRITAESVELVEPENVKAFHAVTATGLSPEALAASVSRAELGVVLPDGEHLMVRVDAIRREASGRVAPGWDDDLAGMLAYAASKGWTDDTGERLRAHIERD